MPFSYHTGQIPDLTLHYAFPLAYSALSWSPSKESYHCRHCCGRRETPCAFSSRGKEYAILKASILPSVRRKVQTQFHSTYICARTSRKSPWFAACAAWWRPCLPSMTHRAGAWIISSMSSWTCRSRVAKITASASQLLASAFSTLESVSEQHAHLLAR